ncbi:alpha-(1,3)-fucosyltransferase C-like [Gigantopelta aegis]|uniref:alpha-(1,3)-fucosyltransferase C-like n=1 Tax=Gigantopelta aegis TaxID=1735272 RepID=UPI001B88C224|nr:alpha-(1,3)-fucosyltransferase C-like [Gigantopelta aegis]XP_041370589.1 alpha-(1,3)-fucosyltransferase C-like [Gigantopelta aegis]
MGTGLRFRMRHVFYCLLTVTFVLFCVLTLPIKLCCTQRGHTVQSGPHIRKFPERAWRNTSQKIILRWTKFFNDQTWATKGDLRGCRVNKCILTDDKRNLESADAVLFHVDAMFNSLMEITWPRRRSPDQVWVLQNMEAPPQIPLDMERLGGLFNWTAWYRFDSDIPVAYGGYKKWSDNSSHDFASERPKLAAWLSSNCYDYVRRMLIIREVKKHLPLETYGQCGDNQCQASVCSDKLSRYKFYFAIENSICQDYVTEKFWEALRRKQVPVVMGGARYKELAPPHSYVDITDFKDIKILTNFLINLSKDDKEYNKYLEWTKLYKIYGWEETWRMFWCDLCEALHDKSRPAQVYEDLNGWFTENTVKCPQWTLKSQLGRLVDGFRIRWGLL